MGRGLSCLRTTKLQWLLRHQAAGAVRFGHQIRPTVSGITFLFALSIYRNFTLGITLQQPIRQDYYSEETVEIESKSRFMTTLIYNFSLKRKDDLLFEHLSKINR